VKTALIDWNPAFRIIGTRFPAVNLFESLAPPEDWEALAQLEAMTNPRFLDEIGDLTLVPPSERKNGPGASFLMAPFTHPRPGRFSTAAWGALYAAEEEATAIAETVYHQSVFCRDSQLGPVDLDVRVLGLRIHGELHDARKGHPECHHLEDYAPSQALAARLRNSGSAGVLYTSVRREGGICAALFSPSPASRCRHLRYLCYRWDGKRISDIFEKKPLKI
jgi:RES domain-containing protein